MNNEDFNKHEKLFKMGDNLTKNFFKKNKESLLSNSISIQDLQQDVKIWIIETLNKFSEKPEKQLVKIVYNCLKWRLASTVDKSNKQIQKEIRYKEKITNIVKNSNKKPEYEFLINEISTFLTKEELIMVNELFIKNKSMATIAKEMGICRSSAYKIKNTALIKIKEKLN